MPRAKCASPKIHGEFMKMNSAAPVASILPHVKVLFFRPVKARHSMLSTNPQHTAIPSLSRQASDFSALSNNQAKDARSTALCGGCILTRSQCGGLKE